MRQAKLPYPSQGSMRYYKILSNAIASGDLIIEGRADAIWDEQLQAYVNPKTGQVVDDKPLSVELEFEGSDSLYFKAVPVPVKRDLGLVPPETKELYYELSRRAGLHWTEGTEVLMLALFSAELNISKAKYLAKLCGIRRTKTYIKGVKDRILKALEVSNEAELMRDIVSSSIPVKPSLSTKPKLQLKSKP